MSYLDALSDEQFIKVALCANHHAIQLAKLIVQVAGLWDDLVDRDVEVSNERINQGMWAMLSTIPLNPFYREHIESLQPVMQLGMLNWHFSNELEKTPGLSREIAHVARYSAGDVVIMMMGLLGGVDHARRLGPEMKLRLQRDCFANYNAEMEKKYAAHS